MSATSDYFDQLHQYAVELINKGLAYVDELSADEIRQYRGTLKEPVKQPVPRSQREENSPCSKNAYRRF